MNVVIISGNLTRDPEYKVTKGGTSVLKIGVAVNDRRKNSQTGQWEDVPQFVDVIMFGKRTEWLSRNLGKGSKVYVEGKLQYSSWEDRQTGRKRSKIEVLASDIELPPRGQQNGSQGDYGQQPNNYTSQGQHGPQNGSQQSMGGYQQQQYTQDVYSEDIPF